MRTGIRVARFFGFDVRLDLSWFVVFLLVLWTFAEAVFPARVPGLTSVTYALMAWAGAVLFFASVLLHELAHSAVARARGLRVEGITLFIFGGMARIREDAENPRDEFLVTAVGPLSSALIGLALLAFARAGRAWGIPLSVTAVADYLAFLNFVLAVFNLIPGFPLDGGRLFRSLVWFLTKDVRKATRWASYSGRAFGYVMIAVGILELFGGALVSGMWFIFIGWFLTQAAEAGYRQVVLRRILQSATAREAMTPGPETVPADLTLRELVDEYFLRRRYNAFPVVAADGRLIGLVTLTRVKEIAREEWPTTRVESAMIPVGESVTVRPGDSLADVVSKLEGGDGVGRALVVEGGRLEGVITSADVAQWLDRYQQLH
jgi:Zn-dependent protease